jgi:hypothetical protein
MPSGVWIGIAGVVLVAAGAIVRAKTGRKAVAASASLAVFAGWAGILQFLFKLLVPGPVLAVVILAGIAVAILLTAVIGGRSGRAKRPDPDPPGRGRDDRRSPADL